MRTLILAVTILISLPSFSFETTNKRPGYSKIEVISLKNGSYQLDFRSHQAALIQVDIYDERGNFVFTDKVGIRRSFIKDYNFSDLPSGNYRLELFNNREKLVKQFYHEQIAEPSSKISANISKLEDLKAYELTLSTASILPVWIYIFDSKDNLVHKEEVQLNKNFSKTYNLSALKSEKFSFIVKTKDSSFKPKELSAKNNNEYYSSK